MTKYLTLIIIVFFQIQSFSQEVNLTTPYHSVENHLKYLQKDSYKPSLSAKSIYESEENEKEIATMIKAILDSKGLYVVMDDLPLDANYIDSISKENKYILFSEYPNINLKKYGDEWLYSKETVNYVKDLHSQMNLEEINDLLHNLPDFMFNDFLSLKLWQYLGIFAYIILSFLLYIILVNIFKKFVLSMLKKNKYGSKIEKYISPPLKPLSILVVLWILDAFIVILQLPIFVSAAYRTFVKVLSPILITIIAYRSTDILTGIFEKIAEKTDSTVDDQLVPLVRKALKLTTVILGIIYLIHSLEIDITPLLAGASIGGLALALAAQDMLKNVFGSVTIFTDRPFDVGDWIVFDGQEGTVEEVGIRSTRVRTFYNSLVSIPNGKIADMVIDNMGRRKFRRYKTNIGLVYGTPTEKIDLYVKGLRNIVETSANIRSDNYEIHLNDFAPSSLDILVYIFFEVSDWKEELTERHEYIKRCIELADEIGVEFAFPSQSLYIEEIKKLEE